MGRIIIPSMTPTSSAPEVTTLLYTTGQAFLKGSILVYDSGGNLGKVIEGGTDPTAIVGVALEAPASKPGFSVNFDAAVNARTGTVAGVSIAKANRITIFSGRMKNGATDPVVPATTDIGAKYGLVAVAVTGGNEWVVDQSDTVNVRVEITDVDTTINAVFFRFLESALATP